MKIQIDEESLDLFNTYRAMWACSQSSESPAAVEDVLAPWDEAKSKYLYDLLGHSVILSRPFSYQRSADELNRQMCEMIRRQRYFVDTLERKLYEVLHPSRDAGDDKFIHVVMGAFNTYNISEGTFTQGARATVVGTQVTIQAGQKIIRSIGKIANLLGLEEEFEKFRIDHSMVLNQNKVTGSLNLSIHPLDYATASDNEAGWSSCMSWMDEGCYRLGTVEMMNSPMVICAYVASDHTKMDINHKEWNSKKWRAWIIINKDCIFVNRHYPDHNAEVARMCVEWVKSLAETNLGWKYGKIYDSFDDCSCSIHAATNFMYNDTTGEEMGCVAEGAEEGDSYEFNFSGIANCMCCGEEIPYYCGDDYAGTLLCENCGDVTKCCVCGRALSDDEIYYDDDGNAYCGSCHGERFSYCEVCDSEVPVEDIRQIVFPIDQEAFAADMIKYAAPVNAHEYHFYSYHGEEPRPQDIMFTYEAIMCKDCLDRLIPVRDAFIKNVALPYKHYYRYFDTPHSDNTDYHFDEVPNPAIISFDKFLTIFAIEMNEETPEQTEAIRKVWAHQWDIFCQRLAEKGYFKL